MCMGQVEIIDTLLYYISSNEILSLCKQPIIVLLKLHGCGTLVSLDSGHKY